MIRLSSLPVVGAALGLFAAAVPLHAQKDSAKVMSLRIDTTDAGSRGVVVSDSSLKELARAVAVLAGTVRTVVTETANKPEVRVAAIQLAGRAVAVAQQALTSNVGELERLLAEASRVLADVERTQREKIAKP